MGWKVVVVSLLGGGQLLPLCLGMQTWCGVDGESHGKCCMAGNV